MKYALIFVMLGLAGCEPFHYTTYENVKKAEVACFPHGGLLLLQVGSFMGGTSSGNVIAVCKNKYRILVWSSAE